MLRDKSPWPLAPSPASRRALRPLEFSIQPPLYGKRARELKHKSWLSDFEGASQFLAGRGIPAPADFTSVEP